MLVTYRQPMAHRQPVRVGRLRYGQLWLNHHVGLLHERFHPQWRRFRRTVVRAGAATATVWRSAVDTAERMRPRPLSDAGLLALIAVLALGTLAAAGLIGQALARWMLTLPGDGVIASGGAVAVGAAFLVLMYLVFASRRGRSHRPRR